MAPAEVRVVPVMLIERDFGVWDLYVARGRGWVLRARGLRPFRVGAP